jgi:hypothetical protein
MPVDADSHRAWRLRIPCRSWRPCKSGVVEVPVNLGANSAERGTMPPRSPVPRDRADHRSFGGWRVVGAGTV